MGSYLSCLFGNKKTKIIMLSLPYAGKTSILYKLALGEIITVIPTIGFNVESIDHKGINLEIWDVGGECRIPPLWYHYIQSSKGIIFVVDSHENYTGEFDEAREHLFQYILEKKESKNLPLLVLANKQDLPNALSPDEIENKLCLNTIKDRPWKVQATSVYNEGGLREGLDWLVEHINQ
ncbi:putative ADP-ribosylation factor [Histomonas meleagridis]|uniref:putative ADP-ribosylation factor n=1 Tax=Histomonas meleagridis TaxID=135588 RepID=UPI003559B21B|nr:putative ADP-ribosylation factor [Histomonas meleagridis]KAH0805254.1 putative ADP-ribosylation factor [Histomonas meleagridis]